MENKATPYRTVFTTLMLGLAVLIALVLCLRVGNEVGARMFETAAWVLFAMSLPQATRSTVESLAKGSGIKGAVNALMTDAKPGEPVPEKPQ